MTKIQHLITLFILCVGMSLAWAQQILHVPIHSEAMQREIQNMIILPAGYDGEKPYPVVYLLNGHNMPHTDWLRIRNDLPELAEKHGVIIVCPSGANSWYFDSPENPTSRYETYVARELVQYIDKHYATKPDRAHRAIAGLSMGGHGALWLAINHQDTYSACGSMSGAVNILPFPNKWNLQDVLGDYHTHTKQWEEHTVCHRTHLIKPGLAIIFDCGTEDFFHEVNEQFHRALLEQGIPHDYTARPGAHNGAYWRNAILYHLLFFTEHFKKQDTAPKS